jgi:uncharacterized protein (DUF2345 family)
VRVLTAMAVMAGAAIAATGAAPTAGASPAPVERVAKLTASDGTTSTGLGASIVVTDELIVAGAPGGSTAHGAVYLYARGADGWVDATQTAKLTASDGGANDGFGRSVAVDGDTIVVGAPGNDFATGAAYVFTKPATGWADATEAAKLTASDGDSTDVFGASVAVNGSTVVAGAPASTQFHPSALYVFERPTNGWVDATQTAKLTQFDAVNQDKLGVSVAMSADVIVAGATGDDTGTVFGHGSLYVYARPAGGWAAATETAKLTASDAAAFDELGRSVAVSGDVIVAGAPCHDRVDEAAASCQSAYESDEGAIYLYEKPATGWATGTETAVLRDSAPALHDSLGSAVAIDGDVVVGGLPWTAGSADVFVRPDDGWADSTEAQVLTPAGQYENGFGGAVAVHAGVIAVGMGDLQDVGSVDVFEPPAETTAPTTSITADPADPDGTNGWYHQTAPSVTVTADDGDGSGVAETRCALDPATPPATFQDLPASCAYLTATSIGADGTHVLYAASIDAAGNAETPISRTFDVDQNGPTVTCTTAPTFTVGGTGSVTASVTDGTSGPATSPASAAADLTTVGARTANVTGYDVAGNATTQACPYVVAYDLEVATPASGQRFKAGTSIPVQLTLRDASGILIGASEAQALANQCLVTARLDTGSRACASYDSKKHRFTVKISTTKTTTTGSHIIWTEVRAGTAYVNTVSTAVILR